MFIRRKFDLRDMIQLKMKGMNYDGVLFQRKLICQIMISDLPDTMPRDIARYFSQTYD